MFSLPAFRRLVRASAVYDVLMTGAFATPWSLLLLREQLSTVNVRLGGAPLPVFEPFHLLDWLPAGQRGAGLVGAAHR